MAREINIRKRRASILISVAALSAAPGALAANEGRFDAQVFRPLALAIGGTGKTLEPVGAPPPTPIADSVLPEGGSNLPQRYVIEGNTAAGRLAPPAQHRREIR